MSEPIHTYLNDPTTGIQEWRVNGVLHRVNAPARIHPSGKQEYFINGKLHRPEGLPSVLEADGTLLYHNHGHLYYTKRVFH